MGLLDNIAVHHFKDIGPDHIARKTRDLARSIVCDIMARWLHFGIEMPLSQHVTTWCRWVQRTRPEDTLKGRAYMLTDLLVAKAWIADRLRFRVKGLINQIQQVSGHLPNGRLSDTWASHTNMHGEFNGVSPTGIDNAQRAAAETNDGLAKECAISLKD